MNFQWRLVDFRTFPSLLVCAHAVPQALWGMNITSYSHVQRLSMFGDNFPSYSRTDPIPSKHLCGNVTWSMLPPLRPWRLTPTKSRCLTLTSVVCVAGLVVFGLSFVAVPPSALGAGIGCNSSFLPSFFPVPYKLFPLPPPHSSPGWGGGIRY